MAVGEHGGGGWSGGCVWSGGVCGVEWAREGGGWLNKAYYLASLGVS